VTQARPATLPAALTGGGGRRVVVSAASAAVWLGALFCLGAGVDPGLEQSGGLGVSIRVMLIVAGLALAALPYVVFARPDQRRAERLLQAVLATSEGTPVLPPFAQWATPHAMFRKLRTVAFTTTAVPLAVLVGAAVTFGLFLDEPVAGVVFAALALVPGAFFWATLSLPRRLSRGVRAGFEAGQCVGVRIDSHITLRPSIDPSSLSWFDAVLPDGQHVVLRTPAHSSWRGTPRGVLDDPALVLVLGRGAHQGLLIAPDRPAEAVWLRGPVPMSRVPRFIQEGFAAEFTDEQGPASSD
jgi:hypothetical protein